MRIDSRRAAGVGILGLVLVALAAVAAASPSSARRAGNDVRRASTIFFTTGARRIFEGELWAARSDGVGLHLIRAGMPTGPEGAEAILAAGARRILCFCRGRQVDSIALDGSQLRRLGRQPRGTRYDVVDLSATGQLFWIRRDSRLLTQNVDGTNRHLVTGESLRKAVIEDPVVPSPSGRRVAFIEGRCYHHGCGQVVETVNVDGTGLTTVFRDRPNREVGDVQWSSDERRLVFSDGNEVEKESGVEDQTDLFVVGSRGSRAQAVTDKSPASEFNAFFSPDGRRLVYSLVPRRGSDRLFTIAVSGGRPAQLLKTGCTWPSCEFPPRVIGWARVPQSALR